MDRALFAAGAIDDAELAVLAPASAPDEVDGAVRAIASRRRRRAALVRAVLGGLVGPFFIAVLSVFLDPLPDLLMVGVGSYVGSVFVGVLVLGLLTGLLVVGVPLLLRSRATGPRALAVLARIPLLDLLAARHAEAEFVTILGPYAESPERARAGLAAACGVLDWSPLATKIRALSGAAQSGDGGNGALVSLAPHLSQETNLAVVQGVAARELPARMAARADEIDGELTVRLRFWVRVAAYALVVVLSFGSFVSLVSRALPGGAPLLGGMQGADQKELEEIMKELEGKPTPPTSK